MSQSYEVIGTTKKNMLTKYVSFMTDLKTISLTKK